MRMHPVLMQDGRLSTNKTCPFCSGCGIYKDDICHCVVMYYGQPPSRRVIEDLKESLKKFNNEGKHASRRQS